MVRGLRRLHTPEQGLEDKGRPQQPPSRFAAVYRRKIMMASTLCGNQVFHAFMLWRSPGGR
jgi:hypothetical protein